MPILTRRRFLATSAGLVAASGLSCATLRAIGIGRPTRPEIVGGVASGDVTATAAIVWSRASRAGRMILDYSPDESFKNPTRVIGPDAVTRNGFTAKIDLQNLPPDKLLHYRVQFESLEDASLSPPVIGSFKTAPTTPRDITFAWSGDTAGQGWGIDPARGGMKIYDAIARLRPDFFIHSGDTIYADVPILDQIPLPDGTVWKNILTPAKNKPAQSIEDFRGAFAYNLLDENVRRFNATVPVIAQWDDHETHNNWYPGQTLADPAYDEKDVDILSSRARQAFLEFMPLRINPQDPQRIYRSYSHGPLLEVFMLDERSYRGKNSPNRQTSLDSASAFLAPAQLEWLKSSLAKSKALWKIIASDMPISAHVKDGKTDYEAFANADDGQPLGRELELANLLQFLQTQRIHNTVWLTADVHYGANIHYHPDRAAFKNFNPFWEFISGPLHAGGFGPNDLDQTFGPQYQWKHTSEKPGNGPGHGFALFGLVKIDAATRTLRVAQHDINGNELTAVEIAPTT